MTPLLFWLSYLFEFVLGLTICLDGWEVIFGGIKTKTNSAPNKVGVGAGTELGKNYNAVFSDKITQSPMIPKT